MPRTPVPRNEAVDLRLGDCHEILASLEPACIDTVVTDPPYGLEFMGKGWDRGVPDAATWRAVRRVMKPGAMLLAFGGTRTFHRLTCAVEDAGFEIRDCMMWLYGTGFPKSLDISKAIDKAEGAVRAVVGQRRGQGSIPNDRGEWGLRPNTPVAITVPATEAARLWNGWGTALKPAWEPIIVAMNPLDGTFAENAVRHGVAGLAIDQARLARAVGDRTEYGVDGDEGAGSASAYRFEAKHRKAYVPSPEGRWPANLVLDEDAALELDRQSGEAGRTGGATIRRNRNTGFTARGHAEEVELPDPGVGGASRFFYVAKASRSERGDGNHHPTVKPMVLMEHLCRLTATPTGGVVLDPFMGSGTTGLAAVNVGRRFIGIEIDPRYFEIAACRLLAG